MITDEFRVRKFAHGQLLSHNADIAMVNCHCDYCILSRAALRGLASVSDQSTFDLIADLKHRWRCAKDDDGLRAVLRRATDALTARIRSASDCA